MVKTIKDIFLEAYNLNAYLSSRGINPKFVSRDTKISHAKSALFQKWKSDRKMAEETITEASESELLAKYLNSRGINVKYATRDMKIAHSKSGEFMKWKRDHQHLELGEEVVTEETDKKDMICMDIPLLIRVLEFTREDMKSDIQLHNMVERLINMRHDVPLDMTHYDEITSNLVKEEVLDESPKEGGKKKFSGMYNPAPKGTFAYDQAMRKKKHDEIEKQQSKDGSGMTSAIDRLQAHMNKEETELHEDKLGGYSRPTRHKKVISKAGNHIGTVYKYDKPNDFGDTYAASYHPHGGGGFEWTHHDNPETAEKTIHRQHGLYKAAATKQLQKAEKHKTSIPEEVEQIDELKKSTLASYKDKSSASLKNAQSNRDAAEPGKDMSKGFADLHAKSNKIAKNRVKGLIGYMQRKQGMKPTSENTLDSMAATEAPSDCSDNTNSTPTTGKSYAAKMVKALKKTVKEETYDWEKDDKSSMVKPYGKAPKINVTDKTGTLGDTKPEARVVMKGGKTLTGQPRDMVEIDPSMKQRPGQQDKGQSTFTSPIAKKSP